MHFSTINRFMYYSSKFHWGWCDI